MLPNLVEVDIRLGIEIGGVVLQGARALVAAAALEELTRSDSNHGLSVGRRLDGIREVVHHLLVRARDKGARIRMSTYVCRDEQWRKLRSGGNPAVGALHERRTIISGQISLRHHHGLARLKRNSGL